MTNHQDQYDRPAPTAALVMGLPNAWVLPPPWFVRVEAPACGAVLEAPAEVTGGEAERYVCDRIAGHEAAAQLPAGDPESEWHRQVIDQDTGRCFRWGPDGQAQVDAALAAAREIDGA